MKLKEKLLRLATAFVLGAACLTGVLPAAEPVMEVSAISTDYPVQLVRISTADNGRNLNITGTADKSALNTWTTNGNQNENWRFDYVGTDSVGSFFKITNMGSGRLITPMGYAVSEGSDVVIYGSESAKSQHWYVSAVSKDVHGNDLHYKITNYENPNLALTYNAAADSISLASFSGADNQKWLLNSTGLEGFAGYCQNDNTGNVKAGNIGGLLGQTVEVSTFDDLKKYATADEPYTIVVTQNLKVSNLAKDSSGRFYCPDGRIYVHSNKTIIGSYSAHTLYNVQFCTASNKGVGNNVIIRNFELQHDSESNGNDSIVVYFGSGKNLWVDHCTFAGHANYNTASTGLEDYDKFFACCYDADYCTVSDSSFGLHQYGLILGYPSDDDASFNKYNNFPRMSIIRNSFNRTYTRAPGLMRYGYFHSLNNYVGNFNMAYTVFTASKVFAEGCYYENGGNVICDWDQTSRPGAYAETGSIFINCKRTKIEGLAQNCTWRPSGNYTYKALSADAAKNYCGTYSGAKNQPSAYHYATFETPGMPSAGYVETPTVGMLENIVIEGGKLFTEVNILDYKTHASWRVDTDIQVGDPMFGDREFTYTTLPSYLVGAEALITACDAKFSTGDIVTFTAGADMEVYVGFDQRVTPLPAWITDWEKMTDTADDTNGVTYDLYRKPLAAGETLTLGANGMSGYCVNYTVFAAEPADPVILIPGDVTLDNVVNAFDLAAQKKGLLGGFPSDHAEICADTDGDGTVTVTDVIALTKYILGMEITLKLA
ncbi:MAG: hypothetical protein IKK51_11005 [Oscillospiraceae bacterium]|nr:hypothetical protein [Oscillospiraceae bacterium]